MVIALNYFTPRIKRKQGEVCARLVGVGLYPVREFYKHRDIANSLIYEQRTAAGLLTRIVVNNEPYPALSVR